jgi:hypothetical protein
MVWALRVVSLSMVYLFILHLQICFCHERLGVRIIDAEWIWKFRHDWLRSRFRTWIRLKSRKIRVFRVVISQVPTRSLEEISQAPSLISQTKVKVFRITRCFCWNRWIYTFLPNDNWYLHVPFQSKIDAKRPDKFYFPCQK